MVRLFVTFDLSFPPSFLDLQFAGGEQRRTDPRRTTRKRSIVDNQKLNSPFDRANFFRAGESLTAAVSSLVPLTCRQVLTRAFALRRPSSACRNLIPGRADVSALFYMGTQARLHRVEEGTVLPAGQFWIQ